MWDNACTIHRRDPFDPAHARLMKRTTILPSVELAVPFQAGALPSRDIRAAKDLFLSVALGQRRGLATRLTALARLLLAFWCARRAGLCNASIQESLHQ